MPVAQNLDFLNCNTFRSFPIKEGVTGLSTDGLFSIPDDFMVDLNIAFSSDVTKRAYISAIKSYSELIVVEVSDNSNVLIGTFTLNPETHVLYQPYALAAAVGYANAHGQLVVANTSGLAIQPSGAFSFTLATAEIEMRCIVPSVSKINSLVFTDQNGNTYSLSGNVKLLARNNLRFSLNGDTVVLDAGDGLGLNKDCGTAAPCIRTIRNVGPDETGNFTLLGTDCAEFTALSSPPGLLLSEICCKPCLSCNEVTELTERTMQLEADLLKIRDFVNNLNFLAATFAQTMNYTCEC